MLTKIIRNFLLMSLFLSGVNAIAIGEAVVITNEVQAEQRQVLVFEELRPDILLKTVANMGLIQQKIILSEEWRIVCYKL